MLRKHALTFIGAALVAALALPAFAQQPTPTTRFRGTLDAIDGNMLSMTTREGQKVDIKLDDNYRVTYPTLLTLDDITENVYVGAGALDKDGKLTAIEVQVFPEASRGVGEGHRVWDMAPSTTMTNANVSEVASDGDARVLTLTFPDGEKQIVVPPDIPVWAPTVGDASLLVPGRYIVLSARKLDDGSYAAAAVSVEKDGVKPPN